ncbi:MAG TPA: MgtC/SapB family protein [Gaiellaceae bacterium]|jgi:putative Mg2+ transporter-C (MgtC) family protein|nr:MgtC/SapB family protein [Gaiellaceae bacterium]
MPDVEWWDVLLRIVIAAALTGAIGLERELRERAAGLRTHMLVGVGSALFTIVSAYAWADFRFSTPEGIVFDPTRIAAQIVTGIGFLGAGAIIRQGLSVRGLTTAAGLWVVAAIGMAAGAGYYSAAAITTGVVLVGLGPLRWVEGGFLSRMRRGGRVLEIDMRREHPISAVLGVVEGRRARVNRVEFEDEENRRQVRIELDVPLGAAEARLVDELASLEEVTAVRWSD